MFLRYPLLSVFLVVVAVAGVGSLVGHVAGLSLSQTVYLIDGLALAALAGTMLIGRGLQKEIRRQLDVIQLGAQVDEVLAPAMADMLTAWQVRWVPTEDGQPGLDRPWREGDRFELVSPDGATYAPGAGIDEVFAEKLNRAFRWSEGLDLNEA